MNMKIANRFSLLLLVIPVVALVTWSVMTKTATNGKDSSLRAMSSIEQKAPKALKDPCWFITLEDKSIPYEIISKREDRQMRGYPNEISLSEAVRIFNEEKQCVSSLVPYPPLTEDELIAAIVAGPDHAFTENTWQSQKDALWKVATQKVMPKGALLIATTGSRVQESPLKPDGTIRAEGISIILRLGLENQNYGDTLKPEQSFVIRRTYFKIEVIR